MYKRVDAMDREREGKYQQLVQAQARIIADQAGKIEDLEARLADAESENERLQASAESAHRARHSADVQHDRARAELRDLRSRYASLWDLAIQLQRELDNTVTELVDSIPAPVDWEVAWKRRKT